MILDYQEWRKTRRMGQAIGSEGYGLYLLREGSMLEAMQELSCVGFRVYNSGQSLLVGERCDGYYEWSLDKAQAQQFVDELQALVSTMETVE